MLPFDAVLNVHKSDVWFIGCIHGHTTTVVFETKGTNNFPAYRFLSVSEIWET